MMTHTVRLGAAFALAGAVFGCSTEALPGTGSDASGSGSASGAGSAGSASAAGTGGALAPPAGSGGSSAGAGGASGGTGNIPVAPDPVSLTYEAEEATLSGVTVATARTGFSGTGYVTGFDAEADELTFTVEVPDSWVYSLTVGYASESGPKVSTVIVNGSASDLALPQSAVFGEAGAGRVFLTEGANTITLRSNWGWYEIDYLRLDTWVDDRVFEPSTELVSAGASEEARLLHAYLRSIYRKQTLSGQHAAYGLELGGEPYSEGDYIFAATGERPAVAGFDFLFYSPVTGFGGDDSTEKAIEWNATHNGIVTFYWHWFSPSGATGEKYFYTSDTTFDIELALTPGTSENTLLLRDLDAIAAELEKLRDEGVPVLWRPLHEAEGGWFWWGAKGAEPAKALYRLMFERYTKQHGLNNLIWVWNSVSPEWYPGNDVVDIVSADLYLPERSYATGVATFDALNELVAGKRLVALSENGTVPDPDALMLYGAYWSWFMTWGGDFVESEQYTTTEQLKKVYGSEYVVTLDELPILRAFR